MISLEEFRQAELRIGEITSAERIPRSDFLMKLTVDLGNEKRTLVSALAKTFTPDQLLGLQVVVVVNLEHRPFKGVTSEGMLLGIETEGSENVRLLTVTPKGAPKGALVS